MTDCERKSEIERGHHAIKDFKAYQPYLALPFGTDDSFDDRFLPLAARFSSGIVIKAIGVIRHGPNGRLIELERIGLNGRKPSTHLVLSERALGERASLVERILGRAANLGTRLRQS